MTEQTRTTTSTQTKPLVSPDTGKVGLYDLLTRIDSLALDAEKADILSDELFLHTPFKYDESNIQSDHRTRNELIVHFNRMQLLLLTQSDYITALKRGLSELRRVELDMVEVKPHAEREPT